MTYQLSSCDAFISCGIWACFSSLLQHSAGDAEGCCDGVIGTLAAH